jgi:hypothetical protein
MQADIIAATHDSVHQEDAIHAHSLGMHMNQIENQRRIGREALQAQAAGEINIQYMVPRPKPKALAIQNLHPQDVHMEPVHPQFQRVGPPPNHQPTQRGQTYDCSNTFKPKHVDGATIAIPDEPDDDLHEPRQGRALSTSVNEPPKSKAKTAAAASSSSSSSSSGAAVPSAKAKAAKPEHTAIGTPPKPTQKIPLYVLDSELKSAYRLGLITDPEDLK